MRILSQNGPAPPLVRLLTAGAAVFFLAAAPAGSTLKADADPCGSCHPGWPESYCDAMLEFAVETCCGEQGGWAHCVSNEWGTYVACDGHQGYCQCDDWGGNCVADLPVND